MQYLDYRRAKTENPFYWICLINTGQQESKEKVVWWKEYLGHKYLSVAKNG